jgi:methionyl aminopeptidase
VTIKIKNKEQIEGIRAASKLAAQTLKYLEQFAKPGITTGYINQKCEEFTRDHGAIPATLGYGGFPASCCTSVNDVICHGVPGKYELKWGDILNIDTTPILNGYFGDTCKMYEIGEVSQDAKDLIKVTRECLWIGIEQCKPGNRFGDIGYYIEQHAKKHGYTSVFQFCGHGVGLAFHEEPEVSHVGDKNTGAKFKPGMTFTIEPMINRGKARCKVDKKDGWTARTIDGKLSAQFEHTILITDTGYEALTDIYHDF